MLVRNGVFIVSQPTREGYLQRVLTGGGANHDQMKRRQVTECNHRDVGFWRGWQCYESHIEEITLKVRLYKDLGSPTLIVSFWDIVLSRTYAHYIVIWCIWFLSLLLHELTLRWKFFVFCFLRIQFKNSAISTIWIWGVVYYVHGNLMCNFIYFCVSHYHYHLKCFECVWIQVSCFQNQVWIRLIYTVSNVVLIMFG